MDAGSASSGGDRWQVRGKAGSSPPNKRTKRMGNLAPNFRSVPKRQAARPSAQPTTQAVHPGPARSMPSTRPTISCSTATRPTTAQLPPLDRPAGRPCQMRANNGIQHAPQHAPRALDTWWIAARADTLGGRGTTLMTPWCPGMRRGGQCVAREGEGPEVDSCDIVVLQAGPTLRGRSKTLDGRGETRVGEAGGQQQAGRGHPPSTEHESRLYTLGEEQDQRLNLPQDSTTEKSKAARPDSTRCGGLRVLSLRLFL